MVKEKEIRAQVRLTANEKLMIDKDIEAGRFTTLTDFVRKSIRFYLEARSLNDGQDIEPLDAVRQMTTRSVEIDKWCQKMGVSRHTFEKQAIDHYLDTLHVTNGRPSDASVDTVIEALNAVSGNSDRMEQKLDSLANIVMNGFKSFSRISSGVSYLIDNTDDGSLPEDEIDMSKRIK